MIGTWGKNIGIPNDFVKVTSFPTTVTDSTKQCRGLLTPSAGTVNVKMANGESRSLLPLIAGLNPGLFKEVTSLGTATEVWAVY